MEDEIMEVEEVVEEVDSDMPRDKTEEESSDYAETPEEAMEKALAETSVEAALDRLRACGFDLVKREMEEELPMEQPSVIMDKKRLMAAKKALGVK